MGRLGICVTRHSSNERWCLIGIVLVAALMLIVCIEVNLFFWLRETRHMFIPGKCATVNCEFNPAKHDCCRCDILYTSKPMDGNDPFVRNITECRYASSSFNCDLGDTNVGACWLNPADNRLWYKEPRLRTLRLVTYFPMAIIIVLLMALVLKKTHIVPDGLLPMSMQAILRFGEEVAKNNEGFEQVGLLNNNDTGSPSDDEERFQPMYYNNPNGRDDLMHAFGNGDNGNDSDESVSFLSSSSSIIAHEVGVDSNRK